MSKVVRRLEMIIEEVEAAPVKEVKSRGGPTVVHAGEAVDLESPWRSSSKIKTAMETFASRIEDAEMRDKLDELCELVQADLGPRAVDPVTGIYNAPRLLRFLYCNEMDVGDARTQVVLNSNARQEFTMDVRRERILAENMSFDTVPRVAEYQKYQPNNLCLCRAKNGSVVSYVSYGSKSDFEGMKSAFTLEEYVGGEL